MLPPVEHLATLPPDEITELLRTEPEGQWFDRKSARIQPRKLAESLVAMANAGRSAGDRLPRRRL